MNFPEELMYTKSHEWIKTTDDGTAVIGISDYAQDALGDLVFVNLPEEDDQITAGDVFADVESVKAVSDIYSPLTGTVIEVNEELLDAPESINDDPYSAWFVKVDNIDDQEEFLTAKEYEEYINTLDD